MAVSLSPASARTQHTSTDSKNKTRARAHTRTHSHARQNLQRNTSKATKGRHYLEAMDHVNGILSTLRECGRCFSAWLRRLSSGTVCTTNSIYFIFRDEDGRLQRVNILVCFIHLFLCKLRGSMRSVGNKTALPNLVCLGIQRASANSGCSQALPRNTLCCQSNCLNICFMILVKSLSSPAWKLI